MLNSYGSIIRYDLAPGEQRVIVRARHPPPHGMRVTRRGGLARIASTVRASSDGAGYARVQDNGALVAWSASTTYTMGLVRDCSIRCHVLYVLHSITATSPLSLLVHLTGEPECSARRRGRVWGVIRG